MVLKDGTNPDTVAKAVGVSPRHRYNNALSGFAADLTEAQLRKLDSDSRVLSLNENRVVGRIGPTRVTPVDSSDVEAADAIPPGHPPQFVTAGVRRIGGLESPTANINNQPDPMDVDIAVLDSGSGPHPDLTIAGGVACADGAGFDDVEGHGTLVAGFAAAKDNAFGAVGVAPGARIWSVRVENLDGSITLENLLCGYNWVVGKRTIEVANVSLGAEGMDTGSCGVVSANPGVIRASPRALERSSGLRKHEIVDPEHLAVCKVHGAGVTIVVSAGNKSTDATGITAAAYPEVITVSALADLDGLPGGLGGLPCPSHPADVDDTFASFSNFGAPVDIAAPGVCITSTLPAFTGFNYATVSGTSFSAPLVAGAAALLKVRNPGWSPEQIRSHILTTAEPGPIPGDPDSFPEGVINVSTF